MKNYFNSFPAKIVNQSCAILLALVFLLFFGLITVAAAYPSDSPVEIQEEIRVSSFRIAAEGEYRTELTGVLRNSSKNTVEISAFKVRISSGSRVGIDEELVMENVTLLPGQTCSVSAGKMTAVEFTRVEFAEASIGGETFGLENPADASFLPAVIFGCLTLVTAFFTAMAVIKLVLIIKEQKLPKNPD